MPEEIEEAVDVANGGAAGTNVIQTVNGSGGAITDSQIQRVNSYLNDIKNIISPGSTATEVGINATGDSVLQATLDGTNANITSASSGGAMDIKTTSSEDKKIKLGYGLSGYKSVVIKDNATNSLQPNNFSGSGIGSDADIMWILAIHAAGETPDFKQCEWNVEGNMNNAGWTVGAWSITQKHNFKILGEKYMSKSEYEFSPVDCDIIAKSQPDHRHAI